MNGKETTAFKFTAPRFSQNKLAYFLTFMSIAQSGIGFLASKEINVVMFITLSFILLMKKNASLVIKSIPWVLSVTLVYIFQTIKYDAASVSMVQILYLFIKFIIPAMYIVIIGKDYFKYFIQIMYNYTIISFVFWLIAVTVPGLDRLLRSFAIVFSKATGSFVVDYKNISFFLLHTFTTRSIYNILPRNAGPFWEPGAFAVYLGVALVMTFIITKSFKNRQTIVFALAMLTTQSTAGYLTLFIFVLFCTLISKFQLKPFVLIFILIGSYQVYVHTPFLSQKVDFMYESQTTQDLSGYTSGRFYSARKSVNAMLRYPLIGRGISRRTAEDEYSEYYGSYGIIDIPARFGLIIGSLYFMLLFRSLSLYSSQSFSKNRNTYAFAIFAILAPVYFSQGVYMSVVNLLIVETILIFKKHEFERAIVNHESQ